MAFENGDIQFANAGITTPLRLAHFLAQAFHETDGLRIERESGNYTVQRIVEVFGPGRSSAAIGMTEAVKLANNGPALFERTYGLGNPKLAKELGNTQVGDGWKYRGGGILQTTGRGNYRRYGQKCGVNFEGNPELVLSAEHALKPALSEWAEGNLNAVADRDDIVAITKRINGGLNGLDSRRTWLNRIKLVLTSVELNTTRPAPKPDIPIPPPPAPKPPPVHPKDVTIGATIVATIAAAISAHKLEIALGVVIVGVVAVFAIHFLWKKKDQP